MEFRTGRLFLIVLVSTLDGLAEDLNEMMEAMKKPVLRIRDDELIED